MIETSTASLSIMTDFISVDLVGLIGKYVDALSSTPEG